MTALERERRAAGLSKTELARRAGVCRQSVWRPEQRGTRPTRNTARRLAGALGVDVEDLFDEVDWRGG